MSYAGFSSFVAPARARADLWLTLVGAVLILILYALGAWAVLEAAAWALPGGASVAALVEGTSPTGALVLLFHFVAMALAAMIVVRLIHRRGALTLLGNRERLTRDFLRTAGIAILVAGFATGLILTFVGVSWKGNAGLWIALLPLALPLILLQTGAEELVFRGYLLQQLGARFGVGLRAVWLFLPALLFALGHVSFEEQGANAWAIFAVTLLFAVITADMTARTGSLGAAWGLHFINNVQALLVISLMGPLSGLSLGTVPMTAAMPAVLPLLAADAAALLIVYSVWRWRERSHAA
ncbi:MAG: CPBP family intramembrane glutamic endopeptidase [Pseudomonadota bacterium]